MFGSTGLAKIERSLRTRPPAFIVSRPRRLRTQPPRHRPWSAKRRGQPWPGRVSTLLNQTYSTPLRLVHACLHVTEQVWQPMHLSRFITIAIWAMTFIRLFRPLVGNLLAATPDDGDLIALVSG